MDREWGDKNRVCLLCSTGNYIQDPVLNHNGKEEEKVYLCITESLCRAAEIDVVNQLYLNKIIFFKKEEEIN